MDKIVIRNLEIFSRHGVLEEERSLGQKFIVSLELFLDVSQAGDTDDLNKTVDYARVCSFVKSFMTENTYRLIEAAAEQMANALLLEYREHLREVTVTIKKPWAPIGMHLEDCSVCIHRRWHTAYISAGSNMGDRKRYLDEALEGFRSHYAYEVGAVSDVFETTPYGGVEQGDFLNIAFEVKTVVSCESLLAFCNELEQKADRRRDERWGPRTLDLDIIFYDEDVINSEGASLTVPHPDMKNRFFVLYPLRQIAPGYMHPIYKKTIVQLLDELLEKNGGEIERYR